MLAVLQRRDRSIRVKGGRERNDDGVHVRHGEHVAIVPDCTRMPYERLRGREVRAVRIRERNDPRVWDAHERWQVRRTRDRAAPENADSDSHSKR